MLLHKELSEVQRDQRQITAPERVVTDGNITTSRGMGTSLDLGLELVRLIKGEELAEQLRTSTQYI